MTGVTVHKYGVKARYYGATAHFTIVPQHINMVPQNILLWCHSTLCYDVTAHYYGATAQTVSVSSFLWEPQTSGLNKHVARTPNQAQTFTQQVFLTL